MPAIAAEAGFCPVRRGRYQHDVSVSLSAALVVGADHHQAGILARSTRVGLKRTCFETGYYGQIVFQLLSIRIR